MEKLFITESESSAFSYLHPEVNNYEPVYDKDGELIGYECYITEE